MSCTKSKEAVQGRDSLTVSRDTVLQSARSLTEVFLKHQCGSDANYRFQIELDKKTATDSGLYCVLYKYDSAIDRQPLDLKYYRFVTNAVVKDSITDTGIDKVEELITISYEDNDEQNSSGESSESIEQDTYTMLTGRSAGKLIKPIFTKSSYGFYYDEMEYTSTTKEYFIFPKQKGGVRNQLLFITEMDNIRTNRTDSCIERYYVKRKLLLSNNELREQTPRLWFVAMDIETPVYSYPAICSESNIGTLASGKKAEVIEQSEIIIEDKDEDGMITRARWIKIKFLSNYGEFGFILNSNPEAVKEEH